MDVPLENVQFLCIKMCATTPLLMSSWCCCVAPSRYTFEQERYNPLAK
jgi:hypothetical protein